MPACNSASASRACMTDDADILLDEEIVLKDEWFLSSIDDDEREQAWTRPALPEQESFQFTIRPFTSRRNAGGEDDDGDDVDKDRFSLVSILEPTKPDLPVDLKRLSLLFTHGNIFRAFPSPTVDAPEDAFSPLSTSPIMRPPSPMPTVPRLTIPVHSPVASPAVPSSTTWSILEMYHSPESPAMISPATSSVTYPLHQPHRTLPRRLPTSPSCEAASSPPCRSASAKVASASTSKHACASRSTHSDNASLPSASLTVPPHHRHPSSSNTNTNNYPQLPLKRRVSGPRPVRPLPTIPRLASPTIVRAESDCPTIARHDSKCLSMTTTCEASPRLSPMTPIRGPRPRAKSSVSVRSITPTMTATYVGRLPPSPGRVCSPA